MFFYLIFKLFTDAGLHKISSLVAVVIVYFFFFGPILYKLVNLVHVQLLSFALPVGLFERQFSWSAVRAKKVDNNLFPADLKARRLLRLSCH